MPRAEVLYLNRPWCSGIERVIEAANLLIAETDIAPQIPATIILDRSGAYDIGGGGMMEGMSAVKRYRGEQRCRSAATRDLTLRIGSSFCPVRQTTEAPHPKTHGRTMPPILKAALNLILRLIFSKYFLRRWTAARKMAKTAQS